MELHKLVKECPNGEKSYYKINADIDKKKNEIILLIEKGILGQKKKKKQTRIIKSTDIKLSSKKGINTIEQFAKEMGNKIYLRKKRDGYDYFEENIEDDNEQNNVSDDENSQINSNITILNNVMVRDEIFPSSTEPTKNNNNNTNIKNVKKNNKIINNVNNKNINNSNYSSISHPITYISPNKMINPTFPVEHKFYEPMLAHPYEKRKRDIIFPCYVQPKLDGVRCVVVDTELYSRYGNKFPTLSHIKEELTLNKDNLILDGELYTDDIYFERIVGLVKKGKKTEEEEKNSLKIYLNVFDYIEPSLTFEQRISNLYFFFKNNNFKHIRLVKTEMCYSETEINYYFEKYTKEGYEGVIMRNTQGKYEPKIRSPNLLKLKKYMDEEFEIIGFSAPNSGSEHGCVIWTCRAQNGRSFNVKPLGNLEDRRYQFEHGKDYLGKKLTVKYQELTNNGVPRFPIGVGIRDYE